MGNHRQVRREAVEIATVLDKTGKIEVVTNRAQADYFISVALPPGIGWSWTKMTLTVTGVNGAVVFQENTTRIRQAAQRAGIMIGNRSSEDTNARIFE